MGDENVVKRMDIKEFRELGLLQEINRRFLHPMGLALEVVIDDNTGESTLGGVWDYRDDPEGIVFVDGLISKDKAERVAGMFSAKYETRTKKFGWHIQPIEPKLTVKED